MDPRVQAALISGGLAIGGGVLEGMGEAGRHEENVALERERLANQRQLADQAARMESMSLAQRGRETAAGMAGAGPTAHAEDFQRAALQRAFLMGEGRPTLEIPGNIAPYAGKVNFPTFSAEQTRALSPESLAANAEMFYGNMLSNNPQLPAPNLGPALGGPGEAASGRLGQFGQQQQANQQAALQQALLPAQAPMGGPSGPPGTAPGPRPSNGPGMGTRIAQTALAFAPMALGAFFGGRR